MKRIAVRTSVFILAALLVGGAFAWRTSERMRTWFTDADTIRVPAPGAPVRNILWQPAEPLRDAADESADQYEPHVSADGSRLVFVRGKAGGTADLFEATRTSEGWTKPEPIIRINTASDELGPVLSRDGKSLYFYSDRAGGRGGYDLWVSRLGEDGWGEAVNLGAAVNTEFNEYGPALTPDGALLYFSSNRPRPGESSVQRDPWPATIREDRARHDYDLYRAAIETSGLKDAAPVSELNTPADEGAPSISPVGDFLYFASNRSGGLGGYDIYRARLLQGVAGAAENVGPAINSALNDLDPSLSTGGYRIYFSSNRALPDVVESVEATSPSRYALWSSGSREVFTEVEPMRAGAALARIWAAAWPWILALLSLILLTLLGYLVLRDPLMRRRLGQLSLMAKCILISLLIHAALLSLFVVWRVGSAIGTAMHSSGGGKISIGSIGSGGLASQVRGGLTDATIVTPTIESPRAILAAPEMPVPTVKLEAAPTLLTMVPAASRDTQPDTAPSTVPPPSQAPVVPTDVVTRSPEAPQPDSVVAEQRAELAPTPIESARASLSAPVSTPNAQVVPTASSSAPAPSSQHTLADPSPSESPRAWTDSSALAPSRTPQRLPAPDSGRGGPEATSALAAPRVSSVAAPIAGTAMTDTRADVPLAGSTAGAPRAERGIAEHSPDRPPAAAALIATGASTAPATTRTPSVESPSTSDSPGREPAPDIGSLAFSAAMAPNGSRPGLDISPPPSAAANLNPAASNITSQRPSSINSVAESVPSDGPTAAASGTPPLNASPSVVSARLPGNSEQPGALPRQDEPAMGVLSNLPAAPASRPGVAAPAALSGAPTAHIDPVGAPAAAPSARAPFEVATTETSAPPKPSAIPGAAAIARIPGLDPDPPTEPAKPAETFAQRDPEKRDEVLSRTGGNQETERAVGLALEWLSRHQSRTGQWSGVHFDDDCRACGGAAEFDSDTAMTGMSLLCYLGAGHTHTADGPYRESVRRALAWIIARDDGTGDLRRGETMYSQTIAAVALCEAFAMTRDPWLEGPARRAVTLVSRARTGQRSASDTSVLGWQIMAIKSAQRAGFNVPTNSYDAARRWLDQVAIRTGRYAYQPGGVPSAAATAEAMFVQQLLGRTREEPRMRESAQYILATPPSWKGGAPTYYWYYATLAMFQQQGDSWKQWNEALVRELLANQHADGPTRGSWDPQDNWSKLGGRIYQTAVCTLSLEVYYRYKLEESRK